MPLQCWIGRTRKKLEELFGTKIDKVKLKEMNYVFPFETGKEPLSPELCFDESQEKAQLPNGVEHYLKQMYYDLERGGAAEALKNYYEEVMLKKRGTKNFCCYCSYKEICRC